MKLHSGGSKMNRNYKMDAIRKASNAGWLVAACGLFTAASAVGYPVSSTMAINEVQSSLTVQASSLGFSDSDTHSLSGTIDGVFDFGASGSFPSTAGLSFTGGSIMPDGAYDLRLGFPPILGVSINASGLVATLATPVPPGQMTRTADAGVVYQFDASQYEVVINQGTFVVTGSTEETTDLSQEPISGTGSPGTLGTLTFMSLGTTGPYTQLSAALDFPIDITQTAETDIGITVDLHVSGAVRAASTFYVALNGVPGDFNQDGQVDGADLPVFTANFGTMVGATPSTGDADADGDVDGNDFLLWQRFEGTRPPGAAAAPAPEPTGGLLAAVAAPLLALRRIVASPSGSLPLMARAREG
jgi:hypothetical protein